MEYGHVAQTVARILGTRSASWSETRIRDPTRAASLRSTSTPSVAATEELNRLMSMAAPLPSAGKR